MMKTALTTNKVTRREIFERIAAMPDGAPKAAAQAYALQMFPARKTRKDVFRRFQPYRLAPEKYIEKFLGWKPWAGLDSNHPGQVEILRAIVLAVRQQLEKRDYERGVLPESELKVWKPGEIIKNWIRVESGNGVGKTKLLSGALNWFFDCFESIVYTFHTNATQDKLTTWKEVGRDRFGNGLPGKLNQTEIYFSADRLAISRSPSDAGGKGEENVKGQHNEFLLFLIDEADGAKDFIFDGIETMLSGGIGVVLMTANPRSRASRFHRLKKNSDCRTLRVSSLYHPNVVEGKEIIPGAVTRAFIEKQLEKTKCQIVKKHDPEKFTFSLPYDVLVGDKLCPAGTVFQPSDEFMTRILGIAPPTSLDKTIISVGVYEASCARVPEGGDPTFARVGVDAARSGADKGTVYIRWQDTVWRSAELAQAETEVYVETIKTEGLKLKDKGVRSLHIRVDAGYGSGVIDALRINAELKEAFDDYQVFEVHFGSRAYNQRDYDNVVTEMYYETAESLKGLSIIAPPEQLEIDLTEREYKFVNRQGKTRKILEPKEDFKKRTGRSPDDGDGLVLAVAPDYCFQNVTISMVEVSGVSAVPSQKTAVEEIADILGI